MKRTLILLAALALAALAAFGQLPRTPDPLRNAQRLRLYLKTAFFTREVEVDADGKGDFASIKAAAAYVLSQPRSASRQWLITVHPGGHGLGPTTPAPDFAVCSYSESTVVTVPSFTTIAGAIPAGVSGLFPTGPIKVCLTGAGQFLLGEGTFITNLGFLYHGATPGATKMIRVPGTGSGYAALQNVDLTVWLDATCTNQIDMIAAETGTALYGYNLSTTAFLTCSTLRNVFVSGTGGVSLYGGRYSHAASQAKFMETVDSGVIKLWWARLDGSAPLVATGGSIQSYYSVYATDAPTVDDETVRGDSFVLNGTCHQKTGTASPEGAVTGRVCDTYVRSDGGASTTFYVKESGTGNTGWVAK